MTALVHIIIFACSIGIVWFFAGVLVDAVTRLARRFRKTGFVTAFFVLGLLTSVGEISVAINSGLANVPGVSVGNLIGASFVLLLFILPLLAIAGRGIALRGAVSDRNLLFMLALGLLPVLLVLDGNVSMTEGALTLLAYGTVVFSLYRDRGAASFSIESAGGSTKSLKGDFVRIIISGAAIFLAARFLVEQAAYFADALSVPPSLIGLILLSIGTNIPEIVIALRAIAKKQTDVAFGNYLGSATMNTLIFAGLALWGGTFFIEPTQFVATAILMSVGLILLYIFARTKCTVSRGEGAILMLFYVAFVIIQLVTLAQFASD